MLPKTSIILPVHNNQKTIDRCLRSLISQEYSNKEIIVVDDGSTDGSRRILRKYKNRVKKIILSKYVGRSKARNIGLRLSKGDIVFFGEADAYYNNNYLSACIKTLTKSTNVGAAVGRLLVWNRNKFLPRCKEVEREYVFYTRKPRGGWIYWKKLLAHEFKSNLEFGEDVDFASKIKARGYDIVWCRDAKWYHTEPESLQEEFMRNFKSGHGIAKLISKNKKLGIVELGKSFYFPFMAVLLFLSLTSQIWYLLFLLFLIPLTLKFAMLLIVIAKLNLKNLRYCFFLPVLWIIRSFARFMGIFFER